MRELLVKCAFLKIRMQGFITEAGLPILAVGLFLLLQKMIPSGDRYNTKQYSINSPYSPLPCVSAGCAPCPAEIFIFLIYEKLNCSVDAVRVFSLERNMHHHTISVRH